MQTRKEFFEKTLVAIIEQGAPSRNRETGACLYRFERDGKMFKCGIGVHIPDTAPEWLLQSRKAIDGLQRICESHEASLSDILNFDVNDENNMIFAVRLQFAHDEAARLHPQGGVDFVESFKEHMRGVARMFGIDTQLLTR